MHITILNELITLAQPNAVMKARYELSQKEKEIMYYVIEEMQGYTSKEKEVLPANLRKTTFSI